MGRSETPNELQKLLLQEAIAMVLVCLNIGDLEYSALGEPFGHLQGQYSLSPLTWGPVLLTSLPCQSWSSWFFLGQEVGLSTSIISDFQLALHVVSLAALVETVACFTQILVFFFTKEKPHHSLSWLGRLPQ